MIIKIGTRIYETDFSIEDLYTFYKYGNGYTIEDKILDGGRYFYFNRKVSTEKLAGSNQAIVEINPVYINFFSEPSEDEKHYRELPL